tara:strand:+ start:1027 stop:1341 length:315 start_codon:yes stop_codon:yes gene_type:complete
MLLINLLLIGSIVANDNSHPPKQIVPFELYAHELPIIHNVYEGRMLVSFVIDEEGNVNSAEIVDSFNVELNDLVLNKVKQTKYQPAIQNGRPVRVRYQLPILFK